LSINTQFNSEVIINLFYAKTNMLGYESERRLKNFLVAVGDGERELE